MNYIFECSKCGTCFQTCSKDGVDVPDCDCGEGKVYLKCTCHRGMCLSLEQIYAESLDDNIEGYTEN